MRFSAEPTGPRIAYFISPHGFGHAARAAAVMEAMYELDPSIRFEIFTQVPYWFFQQSLSGAFSYHSLLTAQWSQRGKSDSPFHLQVVKKIEGSRKFQASIGEDLIRHLHSFTTFSTPPQKNSRKF